MSLWEPDRKYDITALTATKRPGGLDVCHDSLVRGGVDIERILWVIADDLFWGRLETVRDNSVVPTMHFDANQPRKTNPNLYRTLAHSFKAGLEIARKHGSKLFITMQDYVSIPDGGISRFEEMATVYPLSLLTGLCSHSADPYAGEVEDPQGKWTIFDKPFTGMPKDVLWHDARDSGTGDVVHSDPIRWEANWGAVPEAIIHDERVMVDVNYDYGVAYENQDYAMSAASAGYDQFFCDEGNHAMALPHRSYFPWEEAADEPHNNQRKHEAKWSW